MEINSLIFKNPVLKKNYEKEVPVDFILFCYFVAVCGTRSHCIFLPMIVKRNFLAQCKLCIHLGGSMSIICYEKGGEGD